MKTLLTSTVLAAALAVAGPIAVSADQTIYTFPSPARVQVGEILNTSGRGMVMDLPDFCDLNKKKIRELVQNCSMDTWIDKDQEISVRL